MRTFRRAGKLYLLVAGAAHVLVAWRDPERASIVLFCSFVCIICACVMVVGLLRDTLARRRSLGFHWAGKLWKLGVAVWALVFALGFFVWALNPPAHNGGALIGWGMLAVLATFLGAILAWLQECRREASDSESIKG